MKRSRAAIVLACAALGACASPSSSVNFKPPPGWQSGPSMFGMMQMWIKPGSQHSVVMLMRAPGNSQYDVNKSLQTQFEQTKPEKDVPIKICGNQPAQFTVFKAVSKARGGEDEVHMVRTAINGSQYMAMYVRSQGDSTDPSAESALRTLCPRPS